MLFDLFSFSSTNNRVSGVFVYTEIMEISIFCKLYKENNNDFSGFTFYKKVL